MAKAIEDFEFVPVIDLPSTYEVYDFSGNYDPQRELKFTFGVGKYNEMRPNMYSHELFEGQRNIHMGVDIGAPVKTPVKCFYAGELVYMEYNSSPGDYGHTLVTRHNLGAKTLYALYGHLSKSSFLNKKLGQEFKAGETIAWIGDKSENGGWNSHIHFQLSWNDPEKADMPGVVSLVDREQALKDYPDPQLALGRLY